ncbi:MAG: VCBS repeat-containing protein [Opitutaceae bacterium]|nr:VCBS repeat-containing protein [Cytophagales bacterium]
MNLQKIINLFIIGFIASVLEGFALSPPIIKSFSPAYGPVGSIIQIRGAHFSSIPNDNKVSMGGMQAQVSEASDTLLTIKVPAGASFNQIVVETNGLSAVSTLSFDVTSTSSCRSLGQPIHNKTGPSPLTCVGDFNGDDLPDLASANYDSTISINWGTGAGNFSNKVDYGTGAAFPLSLFIFDINGDGHQDLISVSSGNASYISVLLGTGTGTFEKRKLYGLAYDVTKTLMWDYNRDGHQDIVALSGNFCWISYGTEQGTFISPVAKYIDTDQNTNWKFCNSGDFNNDGLLDLANTNYSYNYISIFLGDISGTFVFSKNYATGLYPAFTAVGDFNEDSKQDLAISNSGNSTISVLIGASNGDFAEGMDFQTDGNPYYIKTLDLNGDGHQDIVTSNRNSLTLWLGNGQGSFKERMDHVVDIYSPYVPMINFADLNKDARADIIIANFDSTVSVLLSQLVCPPAIYRFSPEHGPTGSIATIEGTNFSENKNLDSVTFDGLPAEIISATSTQLKVKVPLGASYNNIQVKTNGFIALSANAFNVTYDSVCSPFSFKKEFNTADPNTFVTAGDLNGDGWLDIVTSNNFADKVSVRLGSETGLNESPVNFSTDPRPISVHLIDLKADGLMDLITLNSTGFSILTGNGTGNFKQNDANKVLGTTISFLATSDFNRDGFTDIALTANSASIWPHPVSIHLSDKNGMLSEIPGKYLPSLDVSPTSIAVGDFNEDNWQDLVFTNYGQINNDNFSHSFISILLNEGTGTSSFSKSVKYGASKYPISVAVGDFNNDHHQDLVTANNSENSISLFLGNGRGEFSEPLDFPTAISPYSVVIGDYNGDAFLDVATTSFGDTISFYYGTGSGLFRPRVDYTTGLTGNFLKVGDFDKDGKQDLVIASTQRNIKLLLSDCGNVTSLLSETSYSSPETYVFTDGLSVIVSGLASGTNVSLISLTGKEISKVTSSEGPTRFEAPMPGIYLVQAWGNSSYVRKVSVLK